MAPDRQKVIQAAEKLVSKGRIQAGIDQYRKVLDRHPNDTSTLNRVGDLYVRLERLPKAIELFQQTAESYGRQGFFVKAIAIYKKIIRLDPAQIPAYEALADLYNRQGLTGDSLAQYQVVADYYRKHGDVAAAIAIYDRMVRIEPNNPTRRLQLAGLLQDDGRTPKALDQYYEIAKLMLEHSRGDDAERVLSEGIAIDPENLEFVRKAMRALQDGGFDRLASTLLETAITKNPQANALRLEDAPGKPATAPDPAPVERPSPVERAREIEEAAAVPERGGADDAPATRWAEAEDELGELDLDDAELGDLEIGDLEELPPVESLDPVLPAPAAVAPSPEAGALRADQPVDTDESLGFELDLDVPEEILVEPPEAAAEAPEAEATETEATETEATEWVTEPPERPAPQISGESIKLLIEAEVLSRYGMEEMAIAVLERILRADRRHSEAMARLVRLQLRLGRADEALAGANQLADLVAVDGAPQAWDELCTAMAEQGFTLEDGRFVGAPAPPTPRLEEPEPEQPEAETPEPEPEIEPAAPPQPPPPVEVFEEPSIEVLEEAEAEVEEKDGGEQSLEELVAEAATKVKPRPRPRPDPGADVLGEVMDEIERDVAAAPRPETDASLLAQLERVEAEARSQPRSEAQGPSEPVVEPGVEPPAEPASDEFVDLATELEAELIEEGGLDDELIPNLREQSLEDIVEGFRQGMAETLADSDYDTHYNLGVAYQEMGLIDEAIGEFQLAAKDDRYLVECSSLLASCFLDKNFHDLAIQWYVRGIESPAIDPDSKLGLLYELATLLAAIGEPDAARERFLEIYGADSKYRDVSAKLEQLSA